MQGSGFNYIARVNSAVSKQTGKLHTESPLLGKQTSSKPGGYNQIEQILICEDILNAFNNQDERQAEKYIKKLSAVVLKEKFTLLNKEYHDIKYRKNNLVFKIDSLNNLLNRLGSLQVIDPQDIKLKDDIRQLDINALKKVVKLTNECKVIQFLLQNKGDKMKTIQFMKFVPDQSITHINNLKNILQEYGTLLKRGNPSARKYPDSQKQSKEKDQVQQLKREILFLRKKQSQLQGQKRKVIGLYITQLDDKKVQTHKQRNQPSKEKYISSHQKEIQELSDKNRQMKSQLYLKQAQAQKLKMQNSQLKKKISQIKPHQLIEIANLRDQLSAQKQKTEQKIRNGIDPIQTKYNKIIQEKDNLLRQKQTVLDQKMYNLKTLQDNYKRKQSQCSGLFSEYNCLSLQLRKIQDNEPILKEFQQKNIKLDQQLIKQKQLRSQMENKYRSIQSKMEVASIKINELQNKQYNIGILNKGLQSKLKDQKRQQDDLKNKIVGLNKALEDKESQMDNLAFDKKQAEKELGKLRGQVQKLQRDIKTIKYNNQIQQKRIKQLQNKQNIAEEQRYAIQQQIRTKDEKIKQLSQKIKNNEAQLTNIKQNQKDQHQLVTQNQVLKSEVLNQNEQISSLQSKCQQLSNENTNYRIEKQKELILTKQSNEKQQKLIRQNLKLREQAQTYSTCAQSLKQQNEKQVKKHQSLAKNINLLQQQVDQLKHSTSRQKQVMQHQLARQRQLLQTMKVQYSSLKDDIQNQQMEKQKLESQNSDIHQKNKRLQQIKDDLEKSIENLKDQLKTHKTENQQLKSAFQQLKKENHGQQQQISRLNQVDKQRQNTQTVSRKLNDEIGHLTRQKESFIQQSKEKIEILQKELKNNTQIIKQSQDQAQKYKKQLQQKQSQIQKAQKQSKEAIKDLSDKYAEQCQLRKSSEANHKAQLEKKQNQNINLTLSLQTAQEKLKDSESKYNVLKQLQQLKDNMNNKKDMSLQTENNVKDKSSEFQLLDQSSGKPEVAQNNDLNKKDEELERKRSESWSLLESSNNQLNSEIEKLKSEKQSLQFQLKADKQAHNEKQNNSNQLLQHMRNQSQQFYNTISQKQSQYNALQVNLDKAEKELKQAKEEIQEKSNVQKDLLQQINKYREKESQQQDKQMLRMGQSKKYDQEKKDLNDQLTDIKEKHKQSQKQIGSLKELIKQLNNQLQSQSEQINTLKQQRLNLKKEIETLKKQIQTFKNQIEIVKKQKEEKNNVNSKLMSQNLINKQQNQASLLQLQEKISQNNGKLVQKQLKVSQLSALITQKDKKIQALEIQLQQNKKKIEQNARDLQKLKEHNNLSELLQKIQVLTKEKKLLQPKLVDEQAKTKKLTQDIDKLHASNQNYEQTLSTVNNEFTKCQKNIQYIVSRQNQDMKNAQLSIHRLTQELQLEKKKTKQLEQLFDKLTEANQALENELKMKQKQRQALAFKINQGGDATQKQRMQKKIKKYEGQIEDLTHQVDLLNQTLQEITKFNQSMDAKDIDEQAKKAETQEFIEKLRQSRYREVSQKDETIAKLSEQLSRITQQLKQKSQALMEMQQKMKSTIAQQEKLKAKVEQLTLQSSYKDSQIKILSQQKQLLMKQHSQYQLLNRQQVQKCENRIRMLENQLILRKEGDRTLDSLFQNDLLQYHQHHKRYLKEVIEQKINAKILKSRLLYRYDPLSKINYHNYVDKKENLVLIVKMANGAFVAAFTQDSFEPKKLSNGDGLIISLTNREVFTLIQPNRRAITYDDYYIIFGNSQIRLKSQENKLFSNFAINNGYYASRGFKVSVLLGGANNERELLLESYEIYQLEIAYT